MTIIPAEIIAVSDKQGLVWMRVPYKEAHRVLTLERALFPKVENGQTIEVEMRSEIEGREPHAPGWTAFVVPA